MSTTIPPLSLSDIDHPKIRLMNQCGGLERVLRRLLGHLLSGEVSQLVIDQREELLGGGGIAVLDLRKDLCDINHDPIVASRFLAIMGVRLSTITCGAEIHPIGQDRTHSMRRSPLPTHQNTFLW